jgi:uncharacterized membrane protein required for colicin V production
MIPVEYFWFALIFMLGIIGATRGLSKELGVTTILTLTLFVLRFTWDQFLPMITNFAKNSRFDLSVEDIQAIVFSAVILFVAFISYEGFVLHFPFKEQKGVLKGFFGFLGGLFNGYLVIGTVWDVVAHADYFSPQVSVVAVQSLTEFHNTVINYLPATGINEFLLLAIGMILLILIVLK